MSDLLGDLRGVLYDWKSESIVSSASAFINHAKLVDEKINLCNEHGFAEIIRGIDFYNDWLASNHKQLLTFISDLQSIWEWYEKSSIQTLENYDNTPNLKDSPECKVVMLGENYKFLLINRTTLRCDNVENSIDLWKILPTNGRVSIQVQCDTGTGYEFEPIIPSEEDQVSQKAIQVSQKAIQVLLDMLNTTQTTNQTSSERNNV